jgi:hypothetical protein
MATRANPYYRYSNSYLGNAASGLADAMFGGAVNEKDAAQAQANAELANMRAEQTRGYRDKNEAAVSAPAALAEFFLSGGNPASDPLQRNPDYKPMPQTDFSLTAQPDTSPIASMFMGGATAQDKMAAAIQEANIRGIDLNEMMKSAGASEFLRRAASNPDSALAFAPFVGMNPNQNSALTTGRQDAISARDASEEMTKQRSVNATSLERERIQEGGRNSRATVSAGNNQDVLLTPEQGRALGVTPNANGQYVVRGRATVGTGQDQQPGSLGGDAVVGRESVKAKTSDPKAKPVSVPKTAADRMDSIITTTLKENGYTLDPRVMLALTAEANSLWQNSRNTDMAADSVLSRLLAGEAVNGVSIGTQSGIFSDSKTINRVDPASGWKLLGTESKQ